MNAKHEETKKLAWGGGLVVAASIVALLALGCSQQEEKVVAETTAPTSGIAVTTPAATASATGPITLEPNEERIEPAVGPDSLAPDVAATVEGEITAPGSIVVITAEGSSDVTSMVLTDGLGKKYAFALDPATNRYQVSYRIPIKTTADRVGLSVTATNGANRWKRVWVFVKTRATEETESGC